MALHRSRKIPGVVTPADAAADRPEALPGRVNRLGTPLPPPLSGRNIGILCDDTQRPEAVSLQRAASELGARAALVQANFGLGVDDPELVHTAKVLGRLYDALICIELPADVVARLREGAGIPVHSDPLAQWAVPGAGDDGGALALLLRAALGG